MISLNIVPKYRPGQTVQTFRKKERNNKANTTNLLTFSTSGLLNNSSSTWTSLKPMTSLTAIQGFSLGIGIYVVFLVFNIFETYNTAVSILSLRSPVPHLFYPLTPLPHISFHRYLRQSCHGASCLLSADKCQSVASLLSPSHMSTSAALHPFSFCLSSHPCPSPAFLSLQSPPSPSYTHWPHLPTFCPRLLQLITSRVVQRYARLGPLPAAHKSCEWCTVRTQEAQTRRCLKHTCVHGCIGNIHTRALLENIQYIQFCHEWWSITRPWWQATLVSSS